MTASRRRQTKFYMDYGAPTLEEAARDDIPREYSPVVAKSVRGDRAVIVIAINAPSPWGLHATYCTRGLADTWIPVDENNDLDMGVNRLGGCVAVVAARAETDDGTVAVDYQGARHPVRAVAGYGCHIAWLNEEFRWWD